MYENKLAECTQTLDTRQEPLRKRLQWKKDRLEEELGKVNAAIDALDKHPDFESFHDAVSRAGY
jgi:hypothetical protein